MNAGVRAVPDLNVNEWLTGGIAAVAGGLGLWRLQSRTSLDARKNSREGQWIDTIARERDEAVHRADANYRLFITEQRRADQLQSEVFANRRELRALKEQMHRLAVLVSDAVPNMRGSLTSWLHDSGFPPLDEQ